MHSSSKRIGEGEYECTISLLNELCVYVKSPENVTALRGDDGEEERGDDDEVEIPQDKTVGSTPDEKPSQPNVSIASNVGEFSSVGQILKRPSSRRITKLLSNKVMPMPCTTTSTALSILTASEATSHVERYNEDVHYENAKVRQMDTVMQRYTPAENKMITSALGLLAGMEMKGAIPFKDFTSTFSTFVEVPNTHSAIYYQDFTSPSPMSNREVIMNICWKRMSDKKIILAFHPLTSHPKIEDKDGGSMIRAIQHATWGVTQLDEVTAEVIWDYHMNFGGRLPKAVVNGAIIPGSDRIVSKFTAHFANSIDLAALNIADGKLLGEVLIN